MPGRAFTRRLYGIADDQNGKLKSHHHVRIPQGERRDLAMWLQFLSHPTVLSRPFMDFTTVLTAVEISMFSDAAKNPELGFGAICNEDWMFGQWNSKFILDEDPSIEFLELFGVVAGVLAWIHRFRSQRIVLFCDNESVVCMINATSTKCGRCMTLIRLLVYKSLVKNVRIFAHHISGKSNYFSDSLSRLDFDCFNRLQQEHGKYFADNPTQIPREIWPIQKVWNSLN